MLKLRELVKNNSFTDFEGNLHKYVVVSCWWKSENTDYTALTFEEIGEDLIDIEPKKIQMFTMGFSVCSLEDEFSLQVGTDIARNRAHYSKSTNTILVTKGGFLNNYMFEKWTKDQELYLKENPSILIPGYNYRKKRFKRDQIRENLMDELSPEEKTVYDYLYNKDSSKYSTLQKLLNA